MLLMKRMWMLFADRFGQNQLVRDAFERWLSVFTKGRNGNGQTNDLSVISEETVLWGYRLFLDREPESQAVVTEKAHRVRSTRELREAFVGSDEFKKNNCTAHVPALTGYEPKMEIDGTDSEQDMRVLLKHIQKTWQNLGRDEPYWSVLTNDKFKQVNLERSRAAFYETGHHDVIKLFSTLARNEIDSGSLRSCLEYGCGVGRVTRWLAEKFDIVFGYDISQHHLAIAGQCLDQFQVHNVELALIEKVEDIFALPKVDLLYSIIVLQHNPPPIIEMIIRGFMQALNPNGLAYFQVPTYRYNYSFSINKYICNSDTCKEMEMHVLPQRRVFEILKDEGVEVLEVLEDTSTGFGCGELSNTFLVRKGNKT